MTAELIETEDGFVVRDEYGDVWDVFIDDCCGNYAVQREEQDRYVAGLYSGGAVWEVEDGKTFDFNCRDEFIVEDGQWVENE